MNDLRTAAQQALAALDEAKNYTNCKAYSPTLTWECEEAIAALRAALAKSQSRETGKSKNATTRLGVVCFEAYARSFTGTNRWDIAAEAVRAALAEPVREPVARVVEHGATVKLECVSADAAHNAKVGPLFSTPPQRKPLTDEEIQSIWAKTFEQGSSANAFARAIERAHGIGGQDARTTD